MEPDFTSQIDQGRAGARDVAKIMASFYASLIDEGVPEGPAGEMAASYVAATVRNNQRKGENSA